MFLVYLYLVEMVLWSYEIKVLFQSLISLLSSNILIVRHLYCDIETKNP